MNKEFLQMQKLAGLITEGQYKEKLTEEASNDVERYINIIPSTLILIKNTHL